MEFMKQIIPSIPFSSKVQIQADVQELLNYGYPIHLVEIRLDYYNANLSRDLLLWVKNLIQSNEMKILFTYKNKNLSHDAYYSLIQQLIKTKPDYIDLDVDIIASTLTNLAELALKNNVLIVYSYHNTKDTPSLPIISDMYEFFIQMLPKFISRKGNILKMIFTANKMTDNDTVLQFCARCGNLGIPLVSFCMGDLGKRSRIQCIRNGAAYTFVYIKKPTARGQIHINEIL